MAKFPQMIELIAGQLDLPLATAQIRVRNLRAADVMTNVGRGAYAADMTSKDAMSLVVSLSIGHERSADVSVELADALARPLVQANMQSTLQDPVEAQLRSALDFLKPLGVVDFNDPTAGAAIVGLIDDLRSGGFQSWSGKNRSWVWIDFSHVQKSTIIYIGKGDYLAALSFGSKELRDRKKDEQYGVDRIVRVRTPVFRAIAETLGPLDQ